MTTSILLVEDSAEHYRNFVQACAEGFPQAEVRVVTSGEVALETMFFETMPDLLVLDIDLPGISGLTVLESIRSQTRWKDLPIVVFSIDNSEPTRYASKRLGASYFQVKPRSRSGFMAFAVFLASWLAKGGFQQAPPPGA